MSDSVAVVISAAGLGTRLGLNLPKALVPVGGVPILQRQLEMIHPSHDVVVVAGFLAAEVVALVRAVRPTATVALNHEFTSTGTAASLAKGSEVATDWVVSLDGDLLVASEDLAAFIGAPGACLGLTPQASAKPVSAELSTDKKSVIGLSQDRSTEWEWSGLVKLPRRHAIQLGRGHVFQGVLRHLPMPWMEVQGVEIDDLDDLERAEGWITP